MIPDGSDIVWAFTREELNEVECIIKMYDAEESRIS